MRAMKYCPFCGNPKIVYADDEVPTYAWCGCCKTWISAGSDYEREEIMYIVQKIKSMRKACETLRREHQ